MIFCKSPGLQLTTVAFLLLCSIGVNAQVKKPAPKDSTSYTLSEPQVLLISNLLAYADGVAGNSDKITTRDYNSFHREIARVDSILRVQYQKYHPKKDAKKP